jgi:hypothetical protein
MKVYEKLGALSQKSQIRKKRHFEERSLNEYQDSSFDSMKNEQNKINNKTETLETSSRKKHIESQKNEDREQIEVSFLTKEWLKRK